MNRIETAEYIMREFRKDTRRVIDVRFPRPLEAIIVLEDGKEQAVNGAFAVHLKAAKEAGQ